MRLVGALLLFTLSAATPLAAQSSPAEPPKSGPVEILPLDEVRAGMRATAWTVFSGSKAEPIPVEIIGVMENTWGPGQDIIMAKLGGKAERTNVAAGMSGSPVYYEGKLLGAISLRFSVFSPDAIAGITPIELMLEINELDESRPLEAALPRRSPEHEQLAEAETGWAERVWNSVDFAPRADSYVTAIETPLTISGAYGDVLRLFEGSFRKAGVLTMQGGAVGGSATSLGDFEGALNPGEPIAAVLVSGDMSVSGLGTVSYNDGKRVLAFGHAMFNTGRVDLPIATANVLTVLASKFQPVKVANSATIVGALRQDRHSGIMGVLGETAKMIPVDVLVRSFSAEDRVLGEKRFHYNIFRNQKWTPQLLLFALYNSMFGVNEFSEESTFRLTGNIELAGGRQIRLESMRTISGTPIPPPLALAGWVADKVHRIFTNTAEMPSIENIDVTIDLLPERRLAVVEHAWVQRTEVSPGDKLEGKVFLRPYRGERIERAFSIQVPAGAAKGRLRLVISDAAALNRRTLVVAARDRLMNLSETVALLNEERSNNRLFVSLLQPGVTARLGDKTLPNVPLSVLNVMDRSAGRRMVLESESTLEQTTLTFDSIVSGGYAVNLTVK